ncbi:MAG: hypothetical protein AAF430_12855 [Myxococcota bacterium]
MQLELGDGRTCDDPTPDQVSTALRHLGDLDDAFAILSRSELHYVQTAGDPDSGYLLEYQLGSTDRHFRSVNHEVTLDTTEGVFLAYLAGDEGWADPIEWEPETLAGSGSSLGAAFVIAVTLVLGLLWWASR